ncbi:type III pantothenate kinase [gut metagenome]|uniref:Type III pantothenate kinase n=1 Tax=gut metagenome TaxID=749906 RepID=J9FJY0_9ZZZZ
MVLTVNIGNTHTCIGAYSESGNRLLSAKLSTATRRTADEYRLALRQLLSIEDLLSEPIDGAIIGSVVPSRTEYLLTALHSMTNCRVLTVGPGLKSGLAIRIDDPSQLGSEILCAAVGGLKLSQPPLVLLCADTALSMIAVDQRGSLVGGVILPSPQTAINSLVANTAQLPQIDLSSTGPAPSVLASSSAACLRAGGILGTAFMLDGLLSRFEKELGQCPTVIATGTLPQAILRTCHFPIHYEPSLILDGMFAIWKRNQR